MEIDFGVFEGWPKSYIARNARHNARNEANNVEGLDTPLYFVNKENVWQHVCTYENYFCFE